MVLSSLKRKLFLVSILLLLDKTVNELFSMHLLSVVEIRNTLALLRPFSQSGKEASVRLLLTDIKT